ncbi:MAG TPA: hypothetical protein V6D06_00865 [Trichocoleus sp.]
MNRYLMGAILGGLALLMAFSSGLADWLGGVRREDAAGVRATGLSASSEGSTTTVERAGQAVQRQSDATTTSNQNTGTTGNTGAASGNNAGQTQANNTGTGAGTGAGTGTGAAQPPAQPPATAAGTPAPTNLEAIPALW